MSRSELRLRDAAELDLENALAWYAERNPELAQRLLNDLDVAYSRILESPKQFPIIARDVRRVLLTHFPYGVYYVPHPDRIDVVAILHLMRHPDAWRQRDR